MKKLFKALVFLVSFALVPGFVNMDNSGKTGSSENFYEELKLYIDNKDNNASKIIAFIYDGIISKKFEKTSVDNYGCTAFYYLVDAIIKGNEPYYANQLFNQCKIVVKELLNYGVDINSKNSAGSNVIDYIFNWIRRDYSESFSSCEKAIICLNKEITENENLRELDILKYEKLKTANLEIKERLDCLKSFIVYLNKLSEEVKKTKETKKIEVAPQLLPIPQAIQDSLNENKLFAFKELINKNIKEINIDYVFENQKLTLINFVCLKTKNDRMKKAAVEYLIERGALDFESKGIVTELFKSISDVATDSDFNVFISKVSGIKKSLLSFDKLNKLGLAYEIERLYGKDGDVKTAINFIRNHNMDTLLDEAMNVDNLFMTEKLLGFFSKEKKPTTLTEKIKKRLAKIKKKFEKQ